MSKVHRHAYLFVTIVCAMALVSTGCSMFGGGKKKKAAAGEDGLTPDQIAGDFALEGRDAVEGGSEVAGLQFENVLFAYDSYQIADSETAKIDAVAQYARSNPNVSLVVEGHCDERGSREYNMSLGEHRALAVRAHLIRQGVDASKIQTRSLGEEQPLEAGHDESAWSVNRRGEFVFYQ